MLQIEREAKAEKEIEASTVTKRDTDNSSPIESNKTNGHSHSRSRPRAATDTGRDVVDETTPVAELLDRRAEHINDPILLSPTSPTGRPTTNGEQTDANDTAAPNRAISGGRAFPFKLGTHLGDDGMNASTLTLTSQAGVISPLGDEAGKQPREHTDGVRGSE